MIRTIVFAIVACSIVAVAPASAQELPTRKVSYADLDLNTAAGRHTLDKRIASAIRQVCPQPDSDTFENIMLYQKCRTKATIGSTAQVAAAVDHAIQTASRVDSSRIASR